MLLNPSRACLTLAFLTCFHCSWASHHPEFPDEVVFGIFKHFSVKELRQAALVCKKWEKISLEDSLWEEAARRFEAKGGNFENEPPFYSFINDIPSWREILKRNYFSPGKDNVKILEGVLGISMREMVTFAKIQKQKKYHMSFKKHLGLTHSLNLELSLKTPDGEEAKT